MAIKTPEQIQAEVELLDGLRIGAASEAEAEALEHYADALLWVLGQREESPSQRVA
jgi:hypothetical protein